MHCYLYASHYGATGEDALTNELMTSIEVFIFHPRFKELEDRTLTQVKLNKNEIIAKKTKKLERDLTYV